MSEPVKDQTNLRGMLTAKSLILNARLPDRFGYRINLIKYQYAMSQWVIQVLHKMRLKDNTCRKREVQLHQFCI